MIQIRLNKTNWELLDDDGTLIKLDAYSNSLVAFNCSLINERKEKATTGKNDKRYFGVIECEDVSVDSDVLGEPGVQLFYSTKNRPFWHDEENNNKDNCNFTELITVGREIFTL